MASESELFKLVGASSRTPTSLLMTQLEAVLSRCKDVNERSPSNSCTALHRAASRNRVEVVKRLLKVPGIDATLVDVSGFTPLMYACKRGYSNIARLLLTTVSKVNVTDGKGNNALHLLVTAGDDVTEVELMDVSALLLKAGLNVMERNDDDKLAAELTPPTRARLRAFLRSVESVGSVPLSPLLAVAAKGDAHSLHLLLTHGFTVFDVAEDGNTALHLATLGRHTDIVKRLVECGCPLDLMNDKGETAFMIAARSNARAIAGVLEESGANTTMPPPGSSGGGAGSFAFANRALTFADIKSLLRQEARSAVDDVKAELLDTVAQLLFGEMGTDGWKMCTNYIEAQPALAQYYAKTFNILNSTFMAVITIKSGMVEDVSRSTKEMGLMMGTRALSLLADMMPIAGGVVGIAHFVVGQYIKLKHEKAVHNTMALIGLGDRASELAKKIACVLTVAFEEALPVAGKRTGNRIKEFCMSAKGRLLSIEPNTPQEELGVAHGTCVLGMVMAGDLDQAAIASASFVSRLDPTLDATRIASKLKQIRDEGMARIREDAMGKASTPLATPAAGGAAAAAGFRAPPDAAAPLAEPAAVGAPPLLLVQSNASIDAPPSSLASPCSEPSFAPLGLAPQPSVGVSPANSASDPRPALASPAPATVARAGAGAGASSPSSLALIPSPLGAAGAASAPAADARAAQAVHRLESAFMTVDVPATFERQEFDPRDMANALIIAADIKYGRKRHPLRCPSFFSARYINVPKRLSRMSLRKGGIIGAHLRTFCIEMGLEDCYHLAVQALLSPRTDFPATRSQSAGAIKP